MTDTAQLEIRERLPEDFAAYLSINNACVDEASRSTPGELKMWEELDAPGVESLRLIARWDGQAVGTGYAGRSMFTNATRCNLSVSVLPEFRRRGIGSALYQRVLDHARSMSAKDVTGNVLILDLPEAQHLLDKEGFIEVERMRPSELPLTDLDLSQFSAAEERVKEQGIEIGTLADDESPETLKKLWHVGEVTGHDVPGDAPHDPMPYETYKGLINRPEIPHSAFAIARQGGEIVGFSMLVHQTPEKALTGMTGVMPEYRNRGIAMALKVASARLAREHGYAKMRTFNHVNNPGMLTVNDRLGYVELPHWLTFKKALSD
jgi:mycothiol synthase